MASQVPTQVTTKNENWFRLGALLFDGIQPALKNILHNHNQDPSYQGLPTNKQLLYQELNTVHKSIIDVSLKKKVIRQNQYDVLLPKSQTTDPKTFDTTLTIYVIRSILNLPCSSKKWAMDEIKEGDSSISANVIRAREFRNFLAHHDPDAVDDPTFIAKWAEGVRIINELKYTCDVRSIKTQALDSNTSTNTIKLMSLERRITIVETEIDSVKKDMNVVETKVDDVETKVDNVKTEVDNVETKVDNVETKVDNVETKVDNIETKVDNVETKVDNVETKVDNIETKVDNVETKVDKVEIKADKVETEMESVKIQIDNITVKMDAMNVTNEEKESINLDSNLEDVNEFLEHYKKQIINVTAENENQNSIKRRFKPSGSPDDALMTHSAVLVKGEAGIGKSMYSKDIELRWAKNEFFSQYIILTFLCKDMNRKMTKRSDHAPIYFSNARKVIQGNRTKQIKKSISITKYLETVAATGKLIINIDGIDEVLVDYYLNKNNRDNLQVKVDKGEEITGLETLMGMLYGFIFPGCKIIVFGRDIEISNLESVHDFETSPVFNVKHRRVTKLLPFSKKDVKELTCLKICGPSESIATETANSESDDTMKSESDDDMNSESDDVISCNSDDTETDDEEDYLSFLLSRSKRNPSASKTHPECQAIYDKFKSVEFKNIPSYTTHLIKIFENGSFNNVKMTKTNLQIAVLFNQLLQHTELGSNKKHDNFESMFLSGGKEYKECLQSLMEISRHAIIQGDRQVIGKKSADDQYTYYEIVLNETICAKLDLFYVRKESFQHSLEPYHMTTMEFLAACSYVQHKNEWDTLLELTENRLQITLPYISGLVSGNLFTEDYLSNVLGIVNHIKIEEFYHWLFEVNAEELPCEKGWRGWGDKLTPSLEFLDMVAQESQYPPETLLPKTLVFKGRPSLDVSKDLFDMKQVEKFYKLNDRSKINFESFTTEYPDRDVIIHSWISLDNNDDVTLFHKIVKMSKVKVRYDTWIKADVNNEELTHILPYIGTLYISTQKALFSTVMDVIAGKVPTTPDVHLKQLIIRDLSKYDVDNTYRVLDAALNVNMLLLWEWEPKNVQCTNMERLVKCNENYRNVPMNLYNVTFDENCHCNALISNLRYLAFSCCKLDDQFFECYATPTINPSHVNRLCKQLHQPYILHRFKLSGGYPFDRYNAESQHLDQKDELHHMVLWLHDTKVKNVPPDTLSRGLTNTPALCLCYVNLSDEQWEGLCDSITKGCGVMRELRLVSMKIPQRHLIQLSHLQLLQIIVWKPDDVIELIQYFVNNVTIKRRVRVIACYEGLLDYINDEIYSDLLSTLKSEPKMQQLESDIRGEKYDDRNRRCWWVCELSALKSIKDKLKYIFS